MKKPSGNNDFDVIPTKDNLVDNLMTKIVELEKEIITYKRIIEDNDIDVSEYGIIISDAEYICALQIRKLKEIAEQAAFTEEEARILEILHKNLLRARGQEVDKDKRGKKSKPVDIDKLLKIVNNE